MFEFWHFPTIFVLFKLTCLVTLFDRKFQVFKNSRMLYAEKSSHPTCPVLTNVAIRMNVDANSSSPKYPPYKPPQDE